MNILICSDGTPPSDNATALGALVAKPTEARVTLLGIAEGPDDEEPLRQALIRQQHSLPGADVVLRSGEPIMQILAQTQANQYDLVVVGARHKQMTGPFWRSRRTYEVIKAIDPPVLIAIGQCERLSRFLLCTGGKRYIDQAVRLTARLAAALLAEVTLLHVMAEPPALYADLVAMEEDVDAVLNSRSELGRNLAVEKHALEKRGVKTNVRLRHGFVIDELFAEFNEGQYDLIITGSSRARGPLRHYIMGDLARTIVNRAECPVLVTRSRVRAPAGLFSSLRTKFFSKTP
jgi:nucleotide-binding universal stress UspA family protein